MYDKHKDLYRILNDDDIENLSSLDMIKYLQMINEYDNIEPIDLYGLRQSF